MSTLRVAIVVVLVCALAVLAYLFVNISGRMDAMAKQPTVVIQTGGAQTPAAMPLTTAPDSTQAVIVADPVQAEELAGQRAENERLRKENERLRNAKQVADEEKALMEQKQADNGTPQAKLLEEIRNSTVIGRVTEYIPAENLLLFKVVGSPDLRVQQELSIRRRDGIFATVVVEQLADAEGIVTGSVKQSQLHKDAKEPISTGDELIVTPSSLQLNSTHPPDAPASDVVPLPGSAAPTPAPEMISFD